MVIIQQPTDFDECLLSIATFHEIAVCWDTVQSMSKVYSKLKASAGQQKVPPEQLLQYLNEIRQESSVLVEDESDDEDNFSSEKESDRDGSSSREGSSMDDEDYDDDSICSSDDEKMLEQQEHPRRFEFAGWSKDENSEVCDTSEAPFVSDCLNSSQYKGCHSCSGNEDLAKRAINLNMRHRVSALLFLLF